MGNKILYANKKEKHNVVIASVLLFILSNPYFFWWITENIALRWLTVMSLGFVFYTQRGHITNTDKKVNTLYIFVFLFFLINAIFKGNITLFGILDVLPNLFLVFLLCGNIVFSEKVFQHFSKFFAIIMVLSICAEILYLSGVLPAIGTITNTIQNRTYTVYPFLIVEQLTNDFQLSGMRFCGVYDEPGVIGTLSAVLLCINQFKMKDWKNVVFLITGLLSMSLSFYVILTFCSLAYLVFVRKKYGIAALICVSLFTFYLYTKDNIYFEVLIWDRIEWNEDGGKFAGDNRMTDSANEYYETHVQGTKAFWLGLDDNKRFGELAEGSSSYKIVIAKNGFIFCFLYIFCFILLAIYHKPSKFEFFIFTTLIVANSMQRANVYSPLWVFLYAFYAKYGSRRLTIA